MHLCRREYIGNLLLQVDICRLSADHSCPQAIQFLNHMFVLHRYFRHKLVVPLLDALLLDLHVYGDLSTHVLCQHCLLTLGLSLEVDDLCPFLIPLELFLKTVIFNLQRFFSLFYFLIDVIKQTIPVSLTSLEKDRLEGFDP